MREDERDDGRGDDPDGGRGGSGEVAVAKSIVAMSSEVTTALPHDGQNRTLGESSVPQNAQFNIGFSRYRIPQNGPQTSANDSR